MADGQLHLTIHFEGPVVGLRVALQRTLDHLRVCLVALDQAAPQRQAMPDDVHGAVLMAPHTLHALPGAVVGYQLGPQIAEPEKSARGWLLGAALRDMLAAYQLALEEGFVQASLIRANLGGGPTDVQVGWLQQVLDKKTKEAKRFHQLGLRAKLAQLWEATGYTPPEDLATTSDLVASLADARNCLEHRLGIVDDRDLRGGEALVVRWLAMRAIALTAEGEREEVVIGRLLPFAQQLEVQPRRPMSKSFRRGELVEFSVADVTDMAYTLSLFCEDVQRALVDAAQQRGIKPAAADRAGEAAEPAVPEARR